MLKILSQTTTDTVLFIGDDEPLSKVVGLNLGLLKKNYIIDSLGALQTTSLSEGYNEYVGLRARFTKSRVQRNSYSSSLFKRITMDQDKNTRFELKITKGIRIYDRACVYINLSPAEADIRSLLTNDIISKYSRHIKTTEDMCKLPEMLFTTDVSNEDINPKTEEHEEESKRHLDITIARIQFFEKNYKQIYPLMMLKNFSGSGLGIQHEISLAEFIKIDRYMNLINETTIPTTCARKKFIEICQIFKNNNVLPKFKANNFEFIKSPNKNSLLVKVFGIPVFEETKFEHFRYLDHPAINFCADFLDRSRLFDPVEAKISKEIITRI